MLNNIESSWANTEKFGVTKFVLSYLRVVEFLNLNKSITSSLKFNIEFRVHVEEEVKS